MDEQPLLSIVDELLSEEDIKLDDMPEYRLYISQLEEFFNKKLGKSMNDDEDRKAISKTMIQNYIKDGLLFPPDGKSYDRNHVILLMLIYNFKSILSIKDIKALLSPILLHGNGDEANGDIESTYQLYLDLKGNAKSRYRNQLMKQIKEISKIDSNKGSSGEIKDELHLLLLIFTLISEAILRKKTVELLIGRCLTNEEG